MSVSIKWENNNVRVVFEGVVTTDEILDANLLLYGDARYEQMQYQLVDLTKVTDAKVDEIGIKVIASLEKTSARWNPNMKIAHVTFNQQGVELIEQFAKLVKDVGWKVETFETFEEAIAWCEEETP